MPNSRSTFGKPLFSITETKGGFISEDGLFTYSFKDSDLTLYNSLEAIEELHKITFFYSDGINPEQQHLGIFLYLGTINCLVHSK